MPRTITTRANQSMSDVIIQATGSMESGMRFCMDNNVSISDVPAPGSVLMVSDAALALGNVAVLGYLNGNGIVIGTMGSPFAGISLEAEVGSDDLESEDGQVLMVE